jgi:hypothetical protein
VEMKENDILALWWERNGSVFIFVYWKLLWEYLYFNTLGLLQF